jgi:hypothetical protein
MTGATDMSTPVTRGELREELAQLERKLESWGGALLARIQSGERRIESSERRLLARIESGEQRMLERIDASEQRLLAELARHTRASSEDMSAQISVFDEKYADLPPRVSRLETKVFAPKRR